MAGIPSWRDSLPHSYVGARKWGTGINPIHSIQNGDPNMGRSAMKNPDYPKLQDQQIIGHEDWSYAEFSLDAPQEPLPQMREMPSVGTKSRDRYNPEFPSWGPGGDPIPGGTAMRARKRSMGWREQHGNEIPRDPAGYGWRNKEYNSIELDAKVSDPSQYEIQTSMAQRMLPLTNSRAVLRGTDDARADIQPRIIGMKEKTYSGGQRHEDMFPFQQEQTHRPFKFRQMGTGHAEWMEVNEMYVSVPITRSLPADVSMGDYETSYDTGEQYTGEEDYFYG